jgi:hypothetical protein
MHITQHTDYALRVLIYLASNEQRLVTIQEISERFRDLSQPFDEGRQSADPQWFCGRLAWQGGRPAPGKAAAADCGRGCGA